MVEEKREQKIRLLELLIKAFDVALAGCAAEAEALKMAARSSEDDLSVKLKFLEAKEMFLTAQMMVKDQIDILWDALFKDEDDGKDLFDLLRNQVNNLCIEVFAELPKDRQIFLKAKERFKSKGLELIKRLKDELGS